MAYQPSPISNWIAQSSTPLAANESWTTGWIAYDAYEGFTITRYADQGSATNGDLIEVSVDAGALIFPTTGGTYITSDMTKVSIFSVTRGTHIRYTFTNGPVANNICFFGLRANSGASSPQIHTVWQSILSAMTSALTKAMISLPDSPTVGGVFAFITRTANSMNVNVTNAVPVNATVVGTPDVNVANVPAVTVSGTPNVAVTNTPAVTISGTPSVNATIVGTPSVAIASAPILAVQPSEVPTFTLWSGPQAFVANKHFLSIYNGGAGTVRVHSITLANLQLASVNGVAVRFDMTRFAVAPVGGGNAVITANDSTDTLPAGVVALTAPTIAALGSVMRSVATTNDEVGSTNANQALSMLGANLALDSWEAKPLILRPGQGVTIQMVTATVLGSFGVQAVITTV